MNAATEEKINKRLLEIHGQGKTIVEAIRLVADEFGLDLAKAKQVVSRHESWRQIVRANQPLHDEIEIMAKRRQK